MCPQWNGASLYVSTDSGATWTPSKANSDAVVIGVSGAAIGAIDDNSAVAYDAANERLGRISGSSAADTDLVTSGSVTFAGFTNPTVGFAVAVGDDGFAWLARTTDGGLTWSTVKF